MKITILAVGKIKEKWMRAGIQEYVKRLTPFSKWEELEQNGECKIVCVNRYCMNLLYAPYWGKQR